MSWIRKVKGRGWRAEARLPGKLHGSPVGPIRRTKGEAAGDLAAHQQQQERIGAARSPANAATPILKLLERWEDSRAKRKRGSDSSRADVRAAVVDIAQALKATVIADITADGLDLWVTDHPKGASRKVKRLLSFLKWAAGAPGVPFDPAIAAIDLPEPARRPRGELMTDQQAASALLQAYDLGGSSVGVAVEHHMLYACRSIDVARLRVGDFDPSGPSVTYQRTKNGQRLHHYLHLNHAKKLARLCAGRAPDAPLFLDPWGRPWRLSPDGKSAQGLTNWYGRHIGGKLVSEGLLKPDQAGIYDLKRWAMTRLNNAAGGDRATVIAMSGHLTPRMVDTYSRSNEIAQRALIAATPFVPTGDVAQPEDAIAVDLACAEPLADIVPAARLQAYPQTPRPVKRGTAAMSAEKRAALGSQGGRKGMATLIARGQRHRLTPEQAREAQRKSAASRSRNAAARRAAAAAAGQTPATGAA